MKLKLEDGVSSQQDLREIILEVRQYANWFAHTAVKNRLAAKGAVEAPVVSPAAIALIRQCIGEKPLSRTSLDTTIAALEDFEKSAKRLTIILAAPAPGGLKKTLVAWCRQHVEPNVLVSFEFNSTLLGGMVVRYGSHIYDWSFRRQILAGLGGFPEVLRHV